ncbi:unnamed protein product [marine sediment metagenome]|uniref:Uncharacterized protein n=1 Tax=marine sediment metagenome TaxID=412755 RepID=X1UNA3_9ZZZZ
MAHSSNDFFQRMCKEALEELTSGEKSWRDIETNTLFLACVGMVMGHLIHRITRPLWFFAGTVFCGLVGWGISALLGG